MFLNKISLVARLSIGFILILLILFTLTVYVINRMGLLADQTVSMYNHPLTVSNAVARINANIIKIHRSMKDVALADTFSRIDMDAETVDKLEKEVYRNFEIVNNRFLGKRDNYQAALDIYRQWKPIRDEVIALMRAGAKRQAADITRGKGAEHVVKIEKAMDVLGSFAQNKAVEFRDIATHIQKRVFHTVYLFLFFAFGITVSLALYLTRSITRPVIELKKAASRIGEGDLDTAIEIDSNDEFGELADSINAMTGDLKEVTASRDELNKEIEERKSAIDALQKSETLLREIQRLTKVGGWEYDIEKMKIIWTDEVYRIYALNPETYDPNNISMDISFYKGEAQDTINQAFNNAVERGEPYDLELPFKTADGKSLWVRTNAQVEFRDGKPVRVFGNIMDITERKQAELKLQTTLNELSRSNAELESFAYIASHDLKEPLRTISGFTDLLAKRYKGTLDKNADEFIGIILDGTDRMGQLIDDLLYYSRITTAKKEFVPVDFNSVLKGVLSSLSSIIEKNNAEISIDKLPSVTADDIQIEQLFQNLIMNATKFRREETLHIKVSAVKEQGEWLFSVRDNGIGIEEEDRGRIFDMFQRLHGRGDYPGTGMGLAICKKIIENHGGRIWVESEAGKGSTFYFTIPEES